jgi:hypothetical protein
MGTEDITKVSSHAALTETAKQAGLAAGAAAATAIAAAATNAAKKGTTTTEFKATVGAIVLSTAVAALNIFAFVPGPWMLPAALGLVAISAGTSAYSISRGSVKKAALAGASAAVTAAAYKLTPQAVDTEDPS